MKLKSVILFLTILLFSYSVGSTPTNINFVEIPTKKMSGKLKGLAFATIRTSIIKEYNFTEPKEIRYVPCSPDFPVLVGDFPCSLLSWDEEAIFVEESSSLQDAEAGNNEPNLDDRLGGKVIVLMSKTKSPNMDGSVVKLGEDEDQLKLFYDKEGYLSHYVFQSNVIVFKWIQNQKLKVLSGIVQLKLDSNSFPVSGKEIQFSTP